MKIEMRSVENWTHGI